eukprot:TRINITY_DN51461_c0_g1_i2.p1 TRINITY_DN51461_c0_g1~~TRINITY_DN51461_c0_g1_i2.p1  ORF type:complete len:511 (-),score=103.00 TRINITY_DN51461_c0_g1_i2:642-2174(-)
MLARTSEPDFVVGVDLGTRGTGFSWTRVVSSGSHSPVLVDMAWNGECDRRKKTSTSILFKDDKPFLFGVDAENRWDNNIAQAEESRQGDDSHEYFLFRVFKMQLCDMDARGKYKASTGSDFLCRSVCGKKLMPIREVIAGSLKLVKELVIRKLQMTDSKENDEIICETSIKWVLTVPAIWSERGKTIMKDSARMAELLNFEIALEPECAALTIRESTGSDFLCRSVCGKKLMPIREVIAGSLKLVKELVIRKLQMTDSKENDEIICETSIKWVLTVPAIWSERGKTIMKDSARMAELLNFEIALEPECAALTIRDQLRISNQKPWDNPSYIVIDAGGGTIDIIAHAIDEGRIHEMADATGCPWGSTNVDQAFISLFERLFEPLGIGAGFFSEVNHQQLKFDLMRSFEVAKDSVSRRFSKEHLMIRIPYDLLDYLLNNQTAITIRECCSEYCLVNGFAEDAIQKSAHGGMLRINEAVYHSLVQGCIGGTLDCLRKYICIFRWRVLQMSIPD